MPIPSKHLKCQTSVSPTLVKGPLILKPLCNQLCKIYTVTTASTIIRLPLGQLLQPLDDNKASHTYFFSNPHLDSISCNMP